MSDKTLEERHPEWGKKEWRTLAVLNAESLDHAEANLERLQNKFEQVTGENGRLSAEVSELKQTIATLMWLEEQAQDGRYSDEFIGKRYRAAMWEHGEDGYMSRVPVSGSPELRTDETANTTSFKVLAREALRLLANCQCTVSERDSGHVSDCVVPQVEGRLEEHFGRYWFDMFLSGKGITTDGKPEPDNDA